MTRISIVFEMSDALITKAVREDCLAYAREHLSVRDVLVILGSAGVFALALFRDAHWLWWIAGLPPLIYALLGLGWVFAFLWLPRAAVSRLAHLPDRGVMVDASESSLSFQTATERLEVAWDELRALKRRPSFWLFCLRSGARIPVPAELLGMDALGLLEAKLKALATP
jgi:hypothetical protein